MAVRIGEHSRESPWLIGWFHDDLCTGFSCLIDHAENVALVGQGQDEKALVLI
ncbi:MAG TPA: hypothetical protein VIM49_03800 [Dermatophilaceae bacterium]|jgi:hypothetical protein